MIEDERRAALVAIAAACGYDITTIRATPAETVEGIRQLSGLATGAGLTDLQRRALLQNLRQAIVITASSGRIESVVRQAGLPRWRFLRMASPEAADAYAAVLRYLGVQVPTSLLSEVERD